MVSATPVVAVRSPRTSRLQVQSMRGLRQSPCVADSGRYGDGGSLSSHTEPWAPLGPRLVSALCVYYHRHTPPSFVQAVPCYQDQNRDCANNRGIFMRSVSSPVEPPLHPSEGRKAYGHNRQQGLCTLSTLHGSSPGNGEGSAAGGSASDAVRDHHGGSGVGPCVAHP
jgi:hypothetical protein